MYMSVSTSVSFYMNHCPFPDKVTRLGQKLCLVVYPALDERREDETERKREEENEEKLSEGESTT